MGTVNEVVATLTNHTEKLSTLLNKAADLQADIKSGRFSPQAVKDELTPALSATRDQINAAKKAALDAVNAIVDKRIAALEKEDELCGADMNDDAKLLSAGISLNTKDIRAILDRNRNNRTMTQIALRYARDHGIDMGGTIYIGNEERILGTRNISSVAKLYCDGWIDKPNALDVLHKFFGV